MSSSGAPTQTSPVPVQSSRALYLTSAICSGLSALTLIATLIYTAASVGSSDSWSTIKSKITGILVSTLVAGLIFAVGLTLLLVVRPTLTTWLPSLVSAIALTLAVSAVCIAAISR
jgi:hypothetical protein